MDKQSNVMAELLGKGLGSMRTDFTPGEKLKGIVTKVARNGIFVDINTKSEGIVDRGELEQDGEVTVKPGQEIAVYYVGQDKGEIRLTTRLRGHEVDDMLEEAYHSEVPVEGRVASERKGGFEIVIGGSRAFCPYSQIDLPGANVERSGYVGQTLTFLVAEHGGAGDIVVSRRRLLEKERSARLAELKESLKVHDVAEGTVTRLAAFGAFVDIGGVEGLIPMRELAFGHVAEVSEVLKTGDHVRVQIIGLDWERERISLSLKTLQLDPWETIGERYHVAGMYHGKVARLTEFGAFVTLEPGIDGLIHISRLGQGKRIAHASEVLKEGQELEVYVESVDTERQRLALTLQNPQIGRSVKVEGGGRVEIGQEVTGRVEEIRPFGVFVKLPNGQTGLLHVSETGIEGQGNKGKELFKRYPPGSELQVVIDRVQDKKISLALPHVASEDEACGDILKDNRAADLGNLGSLFDGLKL